MRPTLPAFIGSTQHQSASQLAEAAIENVSQHRRYRNRKPMVYGVSMDPAGRIVVDHVDNTPPVEWLMTCTYKTDPDDLAEVIRDEIKERAA